MKLKIFLVLCLSTIFSIASQEISDTSFGNGLINFTAKDSSFSIKFAPRFQMRYISTWNHDGEQYGSPEHNFIIRRARLKFDGFAYSPKLEYKIELGLSNRDISGGNQFTRNTPRYILDAVLKWHFADNWELWAGQTKLPGNVERVISSGDLQLVNRSLLNSRFSIDRDIGLQLRHKSYLGNKFLIREKIALSQGEGRNVTEGNEGGLQYTARLEVLPFGAFKSKGDYKGSDLKREKAPKLSMAFTYNLNANAVRRRGVLGGYMFRSDGSLYETDITTLFVDSMFKHNGFSFMGEYAKRTADAPVALDIDGITPTGDVVLVGSALNLQAGYLFKSNYEIAGRYTSVDYETVTNTLPRKQYTLGFNKFVHGHKLKLQSDISYTSADGNEDGIRFRLGFDFHF
ncbi:Phosphate-selective porin O and P [Hyunsoonleella jejuensis]|uniref:Phosphate-selective porin O and P n=1 Tax=Hyunsoonleella jejuensis TaxID=419940 RepID=A0A1H9A565_9FLAO|nr:porin [Hyunsoonleella jejuensis]SEP71799.1 Phosphate-selective porin O and P [Hyunsoonleella jejuensis]